MSAVWYLRSFPDWKHHRYCLPSHKDILLHDEPFLRCRTDADRCSSPWWKDIIQTAWTFVSISMDSGRQWQQKHEESLSLPLTITAHGIKSPPLPNADKRNLLTNRHTHKDIRQECPNIGIYPEWWYLLSTKWMRLLSLFSCLSWYALDGVSDQSRCGRI